MLPKNRRISRSDFKNLTRGQAYHGPHLSLFVYKKENPLASASPSQFSFSASKKISIKAVDRNKLRRRGYATIRDVIKHIEPGYYAAFSFKKGAEKATFSEIRDTVLQLLERSSVISMIDRNPLETILDSVSSTE